MHPEDTPFNSSDAGIQKQSSLPTLTYRNIYSADINNILYEYYTAIADRFSGLVRGTNTFVAGKENSEQTR